MPRKAPHMPGRLAETAFETFATHGFDKISLDQIATEAGVTKGSIYCHYKSKHELILAACAHYYRTYQERVHCEIATIIDPLERLRRVLELSVHTCVIDQRSRVFTTEVFALSLRFADVRQGWAQFYSTVREMYVGLTLGAQASGQLQVDNAREGADMMLAAMEGIKQRATFEPHIAHPQAQENLVAGLLEILGKPVPELQAKETMS